MSSDLAMSNDPYDHFIQQQKYQQNLITMDKSSKFSKKVNKLKALMESAKVNMMNGAMMGFMVGGLFGLILGVYSAFQTRRFAAIPISVLASGGSFGFILGCGSVLRSDTLISQQERLMSNCNSQTQLEEEEWLQVYEFNENAKNNSSLYFWSRRPIEKRRELLELVTKILSRHLFIHFLKCLMLFWDDAIN